MSLKEPVEQPPVIAKQEKASEALPPESAQKNRPRPFETKRKKGLERKYQLRPPTPEQKARLDERTPAAKDARTMTRDQAIAKAAKHQQVLNSAHPVQSALACAAVPLHLRLIERFLIMGKRGGQIIEAIHKEHGIMIDPGLFWDYVERIRDKWEREDRLLRPIWRERQLRKLHDVAERLEQKELWQSWIQLQKMIADIEGNYAPIKVEARAVDPFEGWTAEELQLFVEKGERPRRMKKAVIDVDPE